MDAISRIADAPVVSVITVVRNDAAGLERTMQSVRSQDYPRIEYVVVDGASTDRTCEVLQQRHAEVSRWISEPDSGIYEAMNKGVGLSTGEYVCFMNAGDAFASTDTITRMFVPRPSAEIVWGDCIVQSDRGEEYDSARDALRRLHREMLVCHQSMFTRRTALLQRPFDEQLRIAADYDFLCDRLLGGAPWEYRPFPVSRINDSGLSVLQFRTGIKEKRQVALARFPGKRISIELYFLALFLYMTAKTALRTLRTRLKGKHDDSR